MGNWRGCHQCLWLQFGYPHFSHLREQEVNDILTDIIDDTYPLVRELSNFSKQDISMHAEFQDLQQAVRELPGQMKDLRGGRILLPDRDHGR